MVLDESGLLPGVLSERDCTRDCLALMSQKKICHLPVMDNDKVIGMADTCLALPEGGPRSECLETHPRAASQILSLHL